MAVILLACVVAIDTALLVQRDQELQLTTWWSSVGLGVVLLARSPLRSWPLLAAALFGLTTAVTLAFGIAPVDGLEVAASHAAQALGGALVLTAAGRREATIGSLPDLARLALASGLAAVVAAAVESTARVDEAGVTGQLAMQVAAQHALSVLVFGALLLSPAPRLARRAGSALPGLPPLLVVQSAATLAAVALIFGPTTAPPLSFVPIPLLVWGAIAFELRVAATQLLVVTGAVTLATADDRGPFTTDLVAPELVGTTTLGYLACIALVTLPLAVIVTQRRVLMQRVTYDERLFRRTFSESPLGMVMLRDDAGELRVVEVNEAASRVLGTSDDDLTGRRFADLVEPLDGTGAVLDALRDRSIDSWHGPATAAARPGSRLDLAIAAVSEAASATGARPATVFSAQLLDQTREQDSRRRLEVAHQLTDATLDTAACIILVTDHTGRIVRTNGATEQLTGYDDSVLVGSLLWDSPLGVLTRAETEAMFVWPNRTGFPMVRERLSHTVDGSPIRLVWNNNVVRDAAGAPSYAVLTGVDVTAERSSAGLMAHLLEASIATALIGIDVSGRVTVVNAGASHMLGLGQADLVGRPFVSLLDPAQVLERTGAVGEREAFLCLVGMIGHSDESAARDWTWRTHGGHELVVSMTLSVTDDDVEDRVGFLCVGRDVTAQREGQDTLVAALEKERTAVERLQALDRAKDEFVSTVSHELRTPVTSILGYAELLLDGEVVEPHPQQAGMLETIARNGHRLVAICNDLLLLSGFESREVLGARETYDLREAAGVAEEFARAASAQRPLTITFDCPDEPVLVSGDRGQLDRVLVNLVSNAIKFTDDGGTVAVRLAYDATLGAVVTVGDTGMGIHRDDQELVFQRFYRTEDAQVRAIPGTGLGLSIVAGIVDAHGGSISLDSVPGAGTTVTVRLPADGAAA
jgi:PAS domain S-box-containing protein